MKNILKKLVFALLLLGTGYVYGQAISTNTPYKKKVIEIYTKYMRKVGVSATEIEALKKKGVKAFSERYANAMIAYKFKGGDINYINELVDLELLQARSLMNAEEKRAEEQRRKKEEENRRLREIREKEEAKRKEEREYIENSDLNKIKKEVKEAFEEWAKRGEFEKTEEYNARMRYKEKILEGLIEEKVYDKMKWYNINAIKYNPDTEIYDIEIYSNRDSYSYTKKLQGQIKIEPSLAKGLSQNNLETSFYKSFEYRLFKDGYIYPNHMIIDDKVYMITFPEGDIALSNYKMSDFTFSTNDLGVSQYFVENKMIKLSDIKLVRDEKGNVILNSEAITHRNEYGHERTSIKKGYENLVSKTNGVYRYYKNEGMFSFDIDEEGEVSNIAIKINLFEKTESGYGLRTISRKDFEENMIEMIKEVKWRPAVKDGVVVKDTKVYYFSYDGDSRNVKILEYRNEKQREEIRTIIENKGKTQEAKTGEKKKGEKVGRFLGNVLKEVLTD